MKISYFIIPILVALVAYRGTKYTKQGLDWYQSLRKPSWTPSRKLIKEIWIFLYLLILVSMLLFWTVTQISVWSWVLLAVMLVNGYLNIIWNRTFFVEHNIAKAYKQMIYLNISTIIAIIIMWPTYLLPALLLVPYLIWVAIATKLTKEIWQLNK